MRFKVVNYAIWITQTTISILLIFLVFQIIYAQSFNPKIVLLIVLVSYISAISMMAYLAYLFFFWLRSHRNRITLLYTAAVILIATTLVISLLHTGKSLSNYSAYRTSMPVTGRCLWDSSLGDVYLSELYLYFSVLSFILTWAQLSCSCGNIQSNLEGPRLDPSISSPVLFCRSVWSDIS